MLESDIHMASLIQSTVVIPSFSRKVALVNCAWRTETSCGLVALAEAYDLTLAANAMLTWQQQMLQLTVVLSIARNDLLLHVSLETCVFGN